MPPVMGMALLLSNGLVQVRLAFFFVFFLFLVLIKSPATFSMIPFQFILSVD